MSNEPDPTTATIDLMIDTLAELERIENAVRTARETLTPVCSAAYEVWRSTKS